MEAAAAEEAPANASTATTDGTSTTEQTLQEVKRLRLIGNAAFKASRFEDAIEHYSQALQIARPLADALRKDESDNSSGKQATNTPLAEEMTTLYSNRSASFASLCREYLSRPAARSETAALFGYEPGHLASLALSDAQKVLEAKPKWPKAHSRMGTALFLSERYADAEAAYLKGLELDPSNKVLQDGLLEVTKALQADDNDEEEQDGQPKEADVSGVSGMNIEQSQGSGPASPKSPPSLRKRSRSGRLRVSNATVDDWECTLCLKLLFEPVTTPCGHTFCRTCFTRAIDHHNKCPCCRTVLHIGRDLPITVTMANILAKSFPEEYAERAAEEAQARLAASAVGDGTGDILPALPLFVMSTVMPGEHMSLNIFEPRYRLLIRRAMEGNRRIGMAQVRQSDHSLEDIAVEAELTECVPQPDGRYLIELVGRRRVKILSVRDLDGYRVARACIVADEAPAPDSTEAAELPTLASQVAEQMDALVARLRGWSANAGSRGLRVRELIQRAGPRPATDKQEALSFWAATLAVCFSPALDYEDRTRILEMRSTHARLSLVKDHLGQLLPENMQLPGPCSIM